MITNEQFKILKNPYRNITTKLEILDKNENVIDEIQGICIDGDMSISADSPIRNQGSITVSIEDEKYIPKDETSKIWMDKKIVPYIYINGILVWKCGMFLLDSPTISRSLDSQNMKIPLLDKMCLFSGDYNGELQALEVTINPDTPISTVIELLVKDIGMEKKYSVLDCKDENGNNLTIPYTFKKDGTSTITSVLDEIKELYMGYEYFYDEHGRFIWQKIKDRKYDPIMWTFDSEKSDDFVITFQNNPDWKNIKNVIQIWGKAKDDGTQIKYLLENYDKGQFCINKIGRRLLTHKDEKIFSNEQAKINAEYKAFLHGNLNETINLQTVPVYGLNVNNVIYVNDKKTNINGRYKVTQINTGLGYDAVMSITATKLYYEN